MERVGTGGEFAIVVGCLVLSLERWVLRLEPQCFLIVALFGNGNTFILVTAVYSDIQCFQMLSWLLYTVHFLIFSTGPRANVERGNVVLLRELRVLWSREVVISLALLTSLCDRGQVLHLSAPQFPLATKRGKYGYSHYMIVTRVMEGGLPNSHTRGV